MTPEEELHIARIVKENQPEPFSNIPGGKSGAFAALAICVFVAKDYFADYKSNSEQLTKVSSQQMLILSEVNRMNKTVEDLKMKTDKRYTYEDAAKDLGMIQRQLDSHADMLNARSTWMNNTTRQLDMLEKEVKILKMNK